MFSSKDHNLSYFQKNSETRANRIALFLDNKDISILDVGCGYGFMIINLQELGFQAQGIELDLMINQSITPPPD